MKITDKMRLSALPRLMMNGDFLIDLEGAVPLFGQNAVDGYRHWVRIRPAIDAAIRAELASRRKR